MHRKFYSGNLTGSDHFGYIVVGGLIVLKWEAVDWIHLGRDVDHCRALANISWNINVPQNPGNIMSSYTIISFSKWTRKYIGRFGSSCSSIFFRIFVVYEIHAKES
jgi:hypothetical protein